MQVVEVADVEALTEILESNKFVVLDCWAQWCEFAVCSPLELNALTRSMDI